ncbi:Monocarboxylate permease-like protein [Mycena chlorophos]|uniref:Monocarboxylate permease-like protein n=1 Tax=Mycena chlorophos TaxID=658473 RepID=A0A8H6TMJ1_MYCCL|nr:Monocarboxylate permease-like protein [Mycena chlorophos]
MRLADETFARTSNLRPYRESAQFASVWSPRKRHAVFARHGDEAKVLALGLISSVGLVLRDDFLPPAPHPTMPCDDEKLDEAGPSWELNRTSRTPTEEIRPSLDGTTALSHTPTLTSTAHLTTRSPTPFPEACTKSYLAVFGAFLALFGTFGQMNAFGTFQAWYAQHQLSHLEPATIAWIGSVQLWVFFFSGGVVGMIFDVYGPRWLMCSGTVVYVLSIMLTSISTRYYQYILAQGLLFGLGVGMLFYPSLSSVATYFSRYRATALGIAASGSSLGGVMYPIMLQRLFEQYGFAWGVRISGLVSGVICCIALATVTRYTPPTSKLFPNESTTSTASTPYRKSPPPALLHAFRDARFVLLATGASLVALGLFVPFFFIASYANTLPPSSLRTETGFLVLAILNAGGVLGRIAPAILSDALGRFNILAPTALISGVLCLTMWLLAGSSLPVLLVFAATYGFSSGAFISLITPCVAQISDVRQIGGRIGLLYSVISVPAVIGPPVAGVLLQAGDGSNYTAMILFAGLTLIAGSVSLFAARWKINPKLLIRV